MAEEVYKIKKSDIILFSSVSAFASLCLYTETSYRRHPAFAMLKLFFKGPEYELSHYSKITLLLAFLFIGNKVIANLSGSVYRKDL